MRDQDACVVLVTNRSHLERCFLTVWQLRLFGKYRGEIVVIVGDDLKTAMPAIAASGFGVMPKYFPEIDRSEALERLRVVPHTSEVAFTKPFQFHKVHVFDAFFKQWKKVLYVDTKMRVFNPIRLLLELDCENSLIAHSDAFPDYTRTLESQFNTKDFPDLTKEVDALVPLESDYFQTTMILYDTRIISDTTVQEMLDLSHKFINSNTNEQALMNLWAQSRKLWKKLPTSMAEGKLLYDFWEREPFSAKDYVLLKYPRSIPSSPTRRLVGWAFSVYWRIFARQLAGLQP
jgi:hypothetical protein